MLEFSKAQGAGNDFVIIDACRQSVDLSPRLVRALADRRWGVGCDQVLALAPATDPRADFRYLIFNADGSPAQMCGNGARCLALFARQAGLAGRDVMTFETARGLIEVRLDGPGRATVDMGPPSFGPAAADFDASGVAHVSRGRDTLYEAPTGNGAVWVSLVSMGNPHAVMIRGELAGADIPVIGAALGSWSAFAQGVNVGFMSIIDRRHIGLRVYERGAGETPACGTGACAAAVAGVRRGLLDRQVSVSLPGGELAVSWPDDASSVFLSGPAVIVYRGELDPAALLSSVPEEAGR